MTPATVQHAFARAGVPIVRYAPSPQLCAAHRCVGLDYFGNGLVYRTARIARLVHGEPARIRAIFERILP